MGQWRAVPRCNFSLLCRIGHKDSVPLVNEQRFQSRQQMRAHRRRGNHGHRVVNEFIKIIQDNPDKL